MSETIGVRVSSTLDEMRFDNRFVRDLTGDAEARNFCRQVPDAMYSRVEPTPVASPTLVALSSEMAGALGLNPEALDPQEVAAVFSGNQLLPGMETYAACYGGHQFGGWAGQLGDGRAISLGEVVSASEERWELQLKGAGRTPYSRMGDGRAVMRSSVREFLCSEVMHHLGVPTTRALSLVATGDDIVRDPFYDGRRRLEPGAIVCRAAPSFLRFGSFEILASRNKVALLEELAAFALDTLYPELGPLGPDAIAAMLGEVAERTAAMVVHWMRVGFVHGVMNTDNMSVLGLTIDYGPYGWLEGFEPSWTPNTTDAGQRRYCYGNQPRVGWWNLARFANALVPLMEETAPLEEALERYPQALKREHDRMVAGKLGLEEGASAGALYEELVEVLQLAEIDMTLFFRGLARVPCVSDATDAERLAPLLDAAYDAPTFAQRAQARTLDWLTRYTAQVRSEGRCATRRALAMNAVNPLYVLRNWLAQGAIDGAEQGDATELEALLEVMRRPYTEQPGQERIAKKRPEWARHRPGCSMLSCSS